MLLRKFSWLYRCANWRCRDFFAAENIKDIKSFRAKKIGFNISRNYSGHFSLKTQCTARCLQRVAQRKENTIYNRTTANSRFSEKNKNRKNPLRLMQNGSDEPLILWLAENPASKLGNFQPVTASPYRVLHQAQGDKQKKLATVTIMECSAGRMDNSILFAAVRLVQSWKG